MTKGELLSQTFDVLEMRDRVRRDELKKALDKKIAPLIQAHDEEIDALQTSYYALIDKANDIDAKKQLLDGLDNESDRLFKHLCDRCLPYVQEYDDALRLLAKKTREEREYIILSTFKKGIE